MKRARFSLFLMLILTLTLVATSCDIDDMVEALARNDEVRQLDNTENRSENTNGPKPSNSADNKTSGNEVALTKQNAEEIALDHAGVTSANALNIYTEFEWDDGVPTYEVNFRVALADGSGHKEYEYTIHADTGAVLEYDFDVESTNRFDD